jgi:hypothetical protein
MLVGLPELITKLRAIVDVANWQPTLTECGQVVRDSIQSKTGSGFDINDKKFNPYSLIYKKFKQSRGLSGTLVNLRLTGNMLDNLKQQTSGNICKIFIQGGFNNQKANRNQQGKKPRVFFGISTQAQQTIHDILEKRLQELLK